MVIGAGIAGRLCAWYLLQDGYDVVVYEKSPRHSQAACSYVAAGLLTPMSEVANGDPAIATLGRESLKHWQKFADLFQDSDLIDIRGSVTLTYKTDMAEFIEFERKLAAKKVPFQCAKNAAEEAFDQDHLHYHVIPGEGRVDTARFMRTLLTLIEDQGATVHFSADSTNANLSQYDVVIDTRGFHASKDTNDLRGVRGEVVVLHAPEVTITRPVRVLHPRHPVYIVPRANYEYVIGATSIESEDDSPISVKSLLDLLAGVYNIHHGFRYASIVRTGAALRPAYTDNMPRIDVTEIGNVKHIRLNGLYRHGFLLGPLFAAEVNRCASGLEPSAVVAPYVRMIRSNS